MKRKQKQRLSTILTVGASGVLSLVLLGFTIPKIAELEGLQKEWERIKPIADRGAALQGSEREDPASRPSGDPRQQLPGRDEGIEFGKMVSQCAEAAGIDLDYALEEPRGWPPKLANEETGIPDAYKDYQSESEPGSPVRRQQMRLEFSCDYASLLQFCRKLQEIPRLAQICSIQLNGLGKKLKVEMRVEAYSLAVPR